MSSQNNFQTDVLVIGGGIAGCTAALQLADKNIRVLLVTKSSDLLESNTRYAQGGIVYKGQGDPDLLEKDILKAGGTRCNKDMVRLLAREGPQVVEDLLLKRLAVPFTKNKDGSFHLTKEAAHSTRRILHKQDQTGLSIEQQFMHIIQKHPQITLLTNHTLIDVLTNHHHLKKKSSEKNRCVGAYLLHNTERTVHICVAKTVVLATGGIGQLFLRTVNSVVARGDGLYAAHRAGAKLKQVEFIQFHPTSLYHKDLDNFLISEAVRGEGAQLKNKKGALFMNAFDPRGSLAPRDVVTRGIFKEMLDSGEPCVYLDVFSYVSPTKIKEHFVKIYKTCMEHGIDITKQPLPVAPTAHFFCGGIAVDSWGKTSIKNLYAIGETSCTGIHGSNRLASTSLLECLLWGKRAAEYIAKSVSKIKIIDTSSLKPWNYTHKEERFDPALIQQDWITIKSIMWNYVGIIRTVKRLERAVKDLGYLQYRIDQFYKDVLVCDEIIGLRNGVGTALIIAESALKNKKSDGAHFITKNYFK